MTDTATASHPDLLTWLSRDPRLTTAQVESWSTFLTGLPWRYVRPVVKIAVNSGNHPATALAYSAGYSDDQAFKTAAREHLDRVEA